MSNAKSIIKDLFMIAGVTINGSQPWDITVHNDNFYKRLLTNAKLGLGESYMEKWWDSPNIDQFIYKILKADLEKIAHDNPQFWRSLIKQRLFETAFKFFNFQTAQKAFIVGKKHYSVGNDLFKAMLDKRLIYTDALWKDAANLDIAQENKLKLVCQKLNLKPGMKMLDIGCGWGSLVKYAAENYGVSATGITISQEQAKYAKDACQGLSIDIRFQDYRDLLKNNEKFDRISSLGMFEHVGCKNYSLYMNTVSHCLKEDGIFILSTICSNTHKKSTNPWIFKYIFPNSQIPTITQISAAIEDVFVLEEGANFSADYDKTLMAWHHNINQHWNELTEYNEIFQRMWNFYLLSCAGTFRARKNQLWQFAFSKNGIEGGYHN